MDFEQLLFDSHRLTMDMAAKDIGSDPQLIEELFQLSLKQQAQLSMRASRVFDICCETQPEIAAAYSDRIVEHLPQLHHDSVKRNFLHILTRSHQPLSERNWTQLLGCALDWLVSPQQPTAVRAYCMDVLYNLAQEEPELKSEVIYALETACIESSAAVRGRAKRFMRALDKKGALPKGFEEDF